MKQSCALAHSGRARRKFLGRVGALAGTAGLLNLQARGAYAQRALEISKVRLVHAPAICLAPQYLAEEILRLEGFTEIEYVEWPSPSLSKVVADNRADFTMDTAPALVPAIDSGQPVVVLAGLHAGCYELFASEGIRSVRDLQGKTVAVSGMGFSDQIFIASMAAYVGLDPRKDLAWVVTKSFGDSLRLFKEGKAAAFLGFAPQPQELRAKKIGHVIVNTTQDRPWSQYFCCMITGHRDFVRLYPEATKRVVRAYLKATDICAREPERVARFLSAKGYEPREELSLEVLKGLPYARWRESDPEDTLRFHALRLREGGIIKSEPQKIIAQGTDWRFLNELKKELKA